MHVDLSISTKVQVKLKLCNLDKLNKIGRNYWITTKPLTLVFMFQLILNEEYIEINGI